MFLSKLFKSKASKLITVLGAFAMAMGSAGVFTILSVLANSPVEIIETRADVWPKNPTFYFVPSENWMSDSAVFGIDCYDNSTKKGWIAGTKVGNKSYQGRDVYCFSCAGKEWWVNQFKVFRQSSSGTTWNTSAEYVKVDSNYDSGTNLLVMGQTQTGSGWNVGSGATWKGNFDLIAKTSDQSVSDSTARVFFNNTGTHWTGNCGVRAWGGSAQPTVYGSVKPQATIYNLTWIQDDDANKYWYGYADLPQDITGFQIVKLTAADDYDATVDYYGDNNFTISTGTNRVLYGQADGNTIVAGGAKDDSAGKALMATVLAAINTCSSNSYSGYKAYPNLNTYFYSHATDDAKSYKAQSRGGPSNEYTVQQHFESMNWRNTNNSTAQASVIPQVREEQSPLTVTLWVVLCSGLAGLAAIGSAYFISKRKKRNRA